MIRFFGIVFSLLGILLFSPVFLFLYMTIHLGSKGGGFYKQLRVGQYGRDFYAYELRSMRMGADEKRLITVGRRDLRITHTRYLIRRYKLDELPQLFNVLKDGMSLVGPRPEVRKYVDLYTDDQKKVLSVRPGIIDYVSIEYMDENIILEKTSDPDEAYIEQIVPNKMRYNMKYMCDRSVEEYLKIIFLAFWNIIR